VLQCGITKQIKKKTKNHKVFTESKDDYITLLLKAPTKMMLHRQEHDEKLAHKKDRQVALRTMGNLFSCQTIKIQVIHKNTRIRFRRPCRFCTCYQSTRQLFKIVTDKTSETCIWMTANIHKQVA
jgi:hypothetical protein